MCQRYRDAEWLRRRYRGDGSTQREIAEECGVAVRTIRRWMKRHGIESREVVGENHGLHGEERSDAVKARLSESLSGREMDAAWRERIAESKRGTSVPKAVRARIAETLSGRRKSVATRRRMSEASTGPNNANWAGGYERRYGSGWRRARERVHDRDGVCRNCGEDGDDRRLDVHHIVPVRAFHEAGEPPGDAHDLSNLVLLCVRCHNRAEHDIVTFESGIDDPRDG